MQLFQWGILLIYQYEWELFKTGNIFTVDEIIRKLYLFVTLEKM